MAFKSPITTLWLYSGQSLRRSAIKLDCLTWTLFGASYGCKNGTVGGLYIRNTKIGGPSTCHTRHARYSGIFFVQELVFSGLVVLEFANIFTFSVSRTYKATQPPPEFLHEETFRQKKWRNSLVKTNSVNSLFVFFNVYNNYSVIIPDLRRRFSWRSLEFYSS